MITADVATFMLRFGEFANMDDRLIQQLLDEAALKVDRDTLEEEYDLAVLYYAAHLAVGAARSSILGPAGSMGASVRNLSFRDKSIGFNRPPSGAAGAKSSAEALLSTDVYGMEYLDILRRHVPDVLVAGVTTLGGFLE